MRVLGHIPCMPAIGMFVLMFYSERPNVIRLTPYA